MLKEDLEKELTKVKSALEYATNRLEEAYEKNSKLRIENYELKKKLNLIPPKSISKKNE